MGKIKGFINYGVLSHEYQNIFTVDTPHGHADLYEEIEIILPDGWEASKNWLDKTIISSPNGNTYLGNEIVMSHGENPVLKWVDEKGGHRITLEWEMVTK